MQDVKGGDTIDFYVYFVKEHHVKEVKNPDGSTSYITSIDAKLVVNPSDEYLNQENVQVVSKRRITAQIMEINEVGGIVAPKMYLIGLRFIDGDKPTPVFHLLVKDSEEFRERVKKELDYYLKTGQFIKP